MNSIFKNYPNLDLLYNEVRDYIAEHQGEKGYIDVQNLDYRGCTIRAFVYDADEFKGVEMKVHGVRVKDGDIQVVCEYEPLNADIVYDDDAFKNAAWEDIKDSDYVYYYHTLFEIADFIGDYV